MIVLCYKLRIDIRNLATLCDKYGRKHLVIVSIFTCVD
jgi:hypothetical protein